jgi:hypothetical protein
MTSCRSLSLTLALLMLAVGGYGQEPPAPASTTPVVTAPLEPAPKETTVTKEAAPPKEDPLATGTSPYEVELGFRTLHVRGSEDLYRTQINERSGLLLRTFTLLTTGSAGTSRYFDRLRIDGSDLGAGPAGSLRLEADKAGMYHLRLNYRHTNAFSALPGFANPLLAQGIIPGQHTYDRTRNTFDADIDLLPGGRFTPFAGFSLFRLSGPGTTTYTLGGDEFRLSQNLRQRDEELRAGTGFILGAFYGSVTQGWRRSRGSDSLSLSPLDSGGNNSGPILGVPVSATAVTRQDDTKVTTPFTNLYVTGQAGRRLRVTGNYVRFAADSTGDFSEAASGSFVSFALSRFFNGLTEAASSSARNTTWRGGGKAELELAEHLTAFGGYQKEQRELEGSMLLDSLYRQTFNFGGVDPRDVETVLNAKSSMTRNESVVNAGLSARALGPFAARIEYREAKQDLTVSPDLAEIVVPGNQGGDFERKVKTLDASVSFAKAGFTLGAAYRRDDAGNAVFRTDFRNRDRVRLRGAWNAKSWLRAGITAEETKQNNDQTGIDMDGKVRQYSADLEVTPHEGIAVRGSLSRFRADNDILIRLPQNFTTEPTLYSEDGRAREGGLALSRGVFSLDASAARFDNRGSNPFEIRRLRVRAGLDLPARTKSGLLLEWARDKYREPDASYAGFNATRLGVFVRYRP